MAFAALFFSIPLAFLSSFLWAVIVGGSVLQFLLVYAIAGQIGFVLALFVFLLADFLRRHRSFFSDIRAQCAMIFMH